MKNPLFLFVLITLIACGGNKSTETTTSTAAPAAKTSEAPKYDPTRGEGKWTVEMLNLGDNLDHAMATRGKDVQEVKCASCHRMNEERLVGPGMKGVTQRRKPEWIMNFITNPDPMIDKDPVLQAQLEICLVRMPNQGLTDAEARDVLEYLRQNDGVQ